MQTHTTLLDLKESIFLLIIFSFTLQTNDRKGAHLCGPDEQNDDSAKVLQSLHPHRLPRHRPHLSVPGEAAQAGDVLQAAPLPRQRHAPRLLRVDVSIPPRRAEICSADVPLDPALRPTASLGPGALASDDDRLLGQDEARGHCCGGPGGAERRHKHLEVCQ